MIKNSIVDYFRKVGTLISQTANVLLLNGHPDESISARTYRSSITGEKPWIYIERIINTLFYLFEEDHCRKAFETDLDRAKELIRNYTKR